MSSGGDEIVEYERSDEAARDGIEEEDHPIPLWFNLSFIATIVWAVVYMPWYLFSGWSSESQWTAEVERAEQRSAAVREALPTTNPHRGDAAAVAEGKEIFLTTCAACHKPDGSGLVGPSLVDPYWKYGSDDETLFETLSKGRPLGMPPWGSQLGTDKIWKVLADMETLPQTSEPGMGAPEGWTPDGGPPES